MSENETRQFLEEQFDKIAQASAVDEQSPENENGEQIGQPAQQQPVDLYLDAPKTYRKEYWETFKALPPEMRQYLHERESETEKGFSRVNNELQNKKWLDELASARGEQFSQYGYKDAREWIEDIAGVYDALEQNPQETLTRLAETYGVDFNNNQGGDAKENVLVKRLAALEQTILTQQQEMDLQKSAKAQSVLADFTSAIDETGNPKYPHFEQVRQEMKKYLVSGVSTSLEDAYERAVWSDKDIRGKLIGNQSAMNLGSKISEAQKAKDAGFSPKGKIGSEDLSNLTTRQMLEKQILK